MANIAHELSRLLMRLRRHAGDTDLFRIAICGAQVGPIHVRTQVFATHSATCRPLDFWAMFRRNRADTGTPLTQQRRGNPYFSGQFLSRSNGIREVLLEVHFHSINDSLIPVNSVS